MYNCTEAAAGTCQDGALVHTRISCGNRSKLFVRVAGSYDETSDYASYAVDGCDALVIPVLGSSGKGSASNYKELIGDGFLVTWDDLPLPLARKFTHP
jgi:hypothetical protein